MITDISNMAYHVACCRRVSVTTQGITQERCLVDLLKMMFKSVERLTHSKVYMYMKLWKCIPFTI